MEALETGWDLALHGAELLLRSARDLHFLRMEGIQHLAKLGPPWLSIHVSCFSLFCPFYFCSSKAGVAEAKNSHGEREPCSLTD